MSFSRIAAMLLAPLVSAHLTGCAGLPKATPWSYVDGEWTGHIRSVGLRDIKGRTYEAAAIEIIGGPRLPYRSDTTITDNVECQRIALLNATNSNPVVLLDPAKVGVSVGTLVQIRGRMLLSSMKAPRPDGFIESVTTRADRWESDPELVILLRGKPKRLRFKGAPEDVRAPAFGQPSGEYARTD